MYLKGRRLASGVFQLTLQRAASRGWVTRWNWPTKTIHCAMKLWKYYAVNTLSISISGVLSESSPGVLDLT